MSKIVPFDFEDHQVRVVMIDGEPWWVVNDVCAVLGIGNPHMAAERLESDCLSQTEVLDGRGLKRQTNVVNEPGLYELIFRSDKPEAKSFRRWVTTEVLPTIRKTGGFATQGMSLAEQALYHAQALVEQERAQAANERRLEVVEARIDGIEQRTGWYTAVGYARLKGLRSDHQSMVRLGKVASGICRTADITPGEVHNEMYGKVKTYPEWVLEQAVEVIRAMDEGDL